MQIHKKQNKVKVLVFGHIPKHCGGRQQSGLANVMWSLATHMNNAENGLKIFFCSTDINRESVIIEDVQVVGWTHLSLLLLTTMNFLSSFRMLLRLHTACRLYQQPFFKTFFKVLLLNKTIAEVNPDYLHLHCCESAIFFEAGLLDPSNVVVTIHGIFTKEISRKQAALEKALAKVQLKSLVFVSREIFDKWMEVYGSAAKYTEVILNAYDHRKFYVKKRKAVVKGGNKKVYNLVSIGAITENKGQHRVIKALRLFASENAPYSIRYTMVGKPLEEELKQITVQEVNKCFQINHKYYLQPEQLRVLLWDTDFMILPSITEGFGLVFVESIACGTPVVLPKDLPICKENGLLTKANAVFLESHSVESILEFLLDLPNTNFKESDVVSGMSWSTWSGAARLYSSLIRCD